MVHGSSGMGNGDAGLGCWIARLGFAVLGVVRSVAVVSRGRQTGVRFRHDGGDELANLLDLVLAFVGDDVQQHEFYLNGQMFCGLKSGQGWLRRFERSRRYLDWTERHLVYVHDRGAVRRRPRPPRAAPWGPCSLPGGTAPRPDRGRSRMPDAWASLALLTSAPVAMSAFTISRCPVRAARSSGH